MTERACGEAKLKHNTETPQSTVLSHRYGLTFNVSLDSPHSVRVTGKFRNGHLRHLTNSNDDSTVIAEDWFVVYIFTGF